MNFSYMPELDWHYSYFVFIAISLVVVVSLITLFKRRTGSKLNKRMILQMVDSHAYIY